MDKMYANFENPYQFTEKSEKKCQTSSVELLILSAIQWSEICGVELLFYPCFMCALIMYA